jgi:hypothetical protein
MRLLFLIITIVAGLVSPAYASINYQGNGTVLFVSDANPAVTQLEAAGKTQVQIAADYATFQATWPLAWWQAQQQAANFAYLSTFFNFVNFIDGGTLTTLTGTQVGNFIASCANNYRSKKAAIAAATTSAQVIAIDVTSGYPANP